MKGEYGWPRIWRALMAKGLAASKERVSKLMQLNGIYARGKRKFVVTTDSKHNLPIAPDLLQRNFNPAAPNQVWTGDITPYHSTGQAIHSNRRRLAVASCGIRLAQPSGGWI